jgi:hypothetical protein
MSTIWISAPRVRSSKIATWLPLLLLSNCVQYLVESTSCNPGEYIDDNVACTTCPQGFSTGCTNCPKGFYQNEVSQKYCRGCMLGQYQNEEAKTACVKCQKGRMFILSAGYQTPDSCVKCPSARYQGEEGRSACAACPPGKFSSEEGSSYCKDCPAGKYSKGHIPTPYCKDCPTGYFFPESGGTGCTIVPKGSYLHKNSLRSCSKGYYCEGGSDCRCKLAIQLPCPPGKYAGELGLARCIDCPPGRYASLNASIKCDLCGPDAYQSKPNSTTCTHVQPGYYRSGSTSETECPAGTAGSGGSNRCQKCMKGMFQDALGKRTCVQCPSGFTNSANGSTGCNAAPPGSYIYGGEIKVCNPGHYCEGGNASQTACNKGKYASDAGSVKCFPCAPGTFAASNESVNCEHCPNGWLQKETGQDQCDKPDDGTISVGGAASVVISEGWHSTNCSTDGICQGSEPCPEGTYGNDNRKSCAPCPRGTTSFKGSMSCIPCSKGKFGSDEETTKCRKCPAGFFQSQDTLPSTSCLTCPVGWDQPEIGSATCISLNWKTVEECSTKNDMYLNDSSLDPSQWECESCPIGGDCSMPVAWDDIGPKFGWWKIPENERDPTADFSEKIFAQCLFQRACPGKSHGKFYQNSTCNTSLGFRNNSRLCQACDVGFSRTSSSSCVACVNSGGNSAFISLAIIAMFIFFIVLNSLRMTSFRRFNVQRRRKAFHSTIKRIIVSHVQMISVVLGLSVPWPSLMENILTTATSVASFSEGVNSFQCLYSDIGYAEFYNKALIFSATMPIVISGILAVYWFVVIHVFCGKLKCGVKIYKGSLCPRRHPDDVAATSKEERKLGKKSKKENEKEKEKEKEKKGAKEKYTDADAFISSVVLLWFLLLPSLLHLSSSSLRCFPVGNKMYVFMDLEKECMKDGHLWQSLLVAIPMIAFYALVLPVFFMLLIRRAGPERLTNPNLMLRWGMLHSGYREKKYWWEVMVLLRKYTIIALVTFQSHGKFQLHVALGVLIISLHGHDSQRPFGHYRTGAVNSVLHRYEMASLLILLFMLWSGVFFQLDLCTHYHPFWCSFMIIVTLGSNSLLVLVLFFSFIKNLAERKKLVKRVKRYYSRYSRKKLLSSSESMHEMSQTSVIWVRHYDESSKQRYVENKLTGETKWENQEATAKSGDETALWVRHYDESSQQWYVENKLTSETKWENEEATA